jgi:methionine biosynthesis protein MetW
MHFAKPLNGISLSIQTITHRIINSLLARPLPRPLVRSGHEGNSCSMIDDPELYDNRSFNYAAEKVSHRAEYPIISSLIPPGSSVIDFACGNGSLLQILKEEKGCQTTGIEVSPSGVQATKEKGHTAIECKIDTDEKSFLQKLDQLPNFDFAICNVTIQMVLYPERVLQNMGRLAKKQIVSLPNFAHIQNRLDLVLKGRMPQPMLYGYHWYNTGHIHQLSFYDFHNFCLDQGFRVLESSYLPNYTKGTKPSRLKQTLVSKLPNIFGKIGVFLLEKDPS